MRQPAADNDDDDNNDDDKTCAIIYNPGRTKQRPTIIILVMIAIGIIVMIATKLC